MCPERFVTYVSERATFAVARPDGIGKVVGSNPAALTTATTNPPTWDSRGALEPNSVLWAEYLHEKPPQ